MEQIIIEILWHYQPFKEEKLKELFKKPDLTDYKLILKRLKERGYILTIDNYLYLTEKGAIIGYQTRKTTPEVEYLLYKNIPITGIPLDPEIKIPPVNLDTTQPNIAFQPPIIEVPIITLGTNIKLKTASIETIKPKITPLQPKQQMPPQIPIDNPAYIATPNIDTNLFNKFKPNSENLEKIADLQPTAAEIDSLLEGLPSSSQAGGEVHEDILNIIHTIANLEAEGPIILVVDKKYNIEDLVADIAALFLRIKKQGLPEVYSETTFDEARNLAEKTKELQIREDLAKDLEQGKIQRTLNLLKEWWLENKARIIIFPTEKAGTVYKRLRTPLLSKYVAHLLLVEGKWDEKQAYLLSSIYGFLYEPRTIFKLGKNNLYYQLAPMLKNQMKTTINQIIKKLKEKVDPEYWPQPAPEEQKESLDHYQLKWVILDHLILQGLSPSQIIYEQQLKDSMDTIPDIYVKDKKLAIEIETLYGTIYPEIKINRKIQKYKGNAAELWIVVPNPQALMYAKQLLRLEKHYKNKGQNLTIYTLDLKGLGNQIIKETKTKKIRLIKLQDILQAYKKTS